MDMGINITFSGPVYDPSGYGECARWFIAALHQAGVSVRVEPVCIDRTQPDLGAIGPLCRSLETKRHRTDVKIINLTPEHFSRLTEPDCVNIGYTMFETTRIPDLWVDACNRMQGILVPCRWNREVFQRSGVRVPVRVAAPGVEIPAPAGEISAPVPRAMLQGIGAPRVDRAYQTQSLLVAKKTSGRAARGQAAGR